MKSSAGLAALLAVAALTGCASDTGDPEVPQPDSTTDVAPSVTAQPPTEPPPVSAATTTEHGPLAPDVPDVADITPSGSVDEVESDYWWADTFVLAWWGSLSQDEGDEVCELVTEHGVDAVADVLAERMQPEAAEEGVTMGSVVVREFLGRECD